MCSTARQQPKTDDGTSPGKFPEDRLHTVPTVFSFVNDENSRKSAVVENQALTAHVFCAYNFLNDPENILKFLDFIFSLLT